MPTKKTIIHFFVLMVCAIILDQEYPRALFLIYLMVLIHWYKYRVIRELPQYPKWLRSVFDSSGDLSLDKDHKEVQFWDEIWEANDLESPHPYYDDEGNAIHESPLKPKGTIDYEWSEIVDDIISYSKDRLVEMMTNTSSPVDALDVIPEEWRADKDVMLASVKNFGLSIKYAAANITSDKDVILAAVKSCPDAYYFAARELLDDANIMAEAFASFPRFLESSYPSIYQCDNSDNAHYLAHRIFDLMRDDADFCIYTAKKGDFGKQFFGNGFLQVRCLLEREIPHPQWVDHQNGSVIFVEKIIRILFKPMMAYNFAHNPFIKLYFYKEKGDEEDALCMLPDAIYWYDNYTKEPSPAVSEPFFLLMCCNVLESSELS